MIGFPNFFGGFFQSCADRLGVLRRDVRGAAGERGAGTPCTARRSCVRRHRRLPPRTRQNCRKIILQI